MLFSLLATPVLAADTNSSSSLLSPGMGMAWFYRQSQDFQDLMKDLLGALIFIVGVIFLASTLISTGKAKVNTAFSNSKEKSHNDTATLKIAGYLFMMMAVIYFGLRMFSWL